MVSSNLPFQPAPSADLKAGSRSQATGLSLCNDVVFKALFSRHPHLLADLINAVRHHAAPIRVERILNPHILPQDLVGKHIVLDILAEDASGQRFGVEMQLGRFRHWPQRNVYGIARSLAGQLQAGQDYRDLKPVIGISLLVHDLFADHPAKAHWHFTLRDAQDPTVQLGEALQMHIIELRKAETLGALPAPLLAWIACLLHNLDEAAMNEITHPPVHEALSHLETLYSDEELRLAAERREQALVDAEDMLDQARYEGREKGIQEGAAKLLAIQITRKFGPLPDWATTRMAQADETSLNRWALRLLDAQTLDEIFVSRITLR
ncbi:Rpn family recombination-promoting nuclease/putative transposase [Alcaligenaceae bacterium]|nr:Rpn family recombination-promoting nuclease/putative transposase [Alcaligenaceae bacterium]